MTSVTEHTADDEELLRQSAETHQADMWTALPGIVLSVNLDAQTLEVQPAMTYAQQSPDGSTAIHQLPRLADVPIVWPRAGGFALTFPIAVGDEVLVVFASRCIDAWWQGGTASHPPEHRMHDLSDGFAILAPTSQPKKLAGVSSSNVQLRNSAGDTFVEITPDGTVRAKATNKVIVEAPEIDYTAANVINIKSPTINMMGNINMASVSGGRGTANINADTNFTGGLTSNGKNISDTHTHTSVQGGTGTSGGVS